MRAPTVKRRKASPMSSASPAPEQRTPKEEAAFTRVPATAEDLAAEELSEERAQGWGFLILGFLGVLVATALCICVAIYFRPMPSVDYFTRTRTTYIERM